MKYIKYVFILFLFIGIESKAQNNKLSNSIFWEISGKGLKKPSYLFGTYHYAGKNFLDSMTSVNNKLATADVVVGELLLNDDQIGRKLMPFMQLEDTTLNKVLSESEYKLVANYIKEISGYDLNLMNAMNPTAIQLMILEFTAPKTVGKDNPALDIYFQDFAQKNNKKVIGLETVEDQGKALFGSSIERQKEKLLDNINNRDKYKKQGEDLYRFYTVQDLNQIKNLFAEKSGYTDEEFDNLLKNRNLLWMQKIPTIIKDQSVFIAVGVGHLIDEYGLIKLLKDQGYQVKPLKTN